MSGVVGVDVGEGVSDAGGGGGLVEGDGVGAFGGGLVALLCLVFLERCALGLLVFGGCGLVGVDAVEGVVEPAEGVVAAVSGGEGECLFELGDECVGGGGGAVVGGGAPAVGVDAVLAEDVADGGDVLVAGEPGEPADEGCGEALQVEGDRHGPLSPFSLLVRFLGPRSGPARVYARVG